MLSVPFSWFDEKKLYDFFSFVTILRTAVSACYTNSQSYCQHTINYIFMVCREFIIIFLLSCVSWCNRVALGPWSSVYFFLVCLAGSIIIIRRAKSVDNLRRIVIQNGQSRLINHCPKCRETQSKWQFEENVRKTYRNRVLGFWTLIWHYLWRLPS